jgi:hypothetical protein
MGKIILVIKKASKYLTAPILIFFFGCTNHPPMSELLILDNHSQFSKNDFKMGVTGTTSFNTKDLQQEEAEKKYVNPDNPENITLNNPNSTGVGIHFSKKVNQDFAYSVSVGSKILGLDITHNLEDICYFTGAISASGTFDAIIQRPIIKFKNSISSLGIYYQYNKYFVNSDDNGTRHPDLRFEPDEYFSSSTYGIRTSSFVFYDSGRKNDFSLLFTFTAGYSTLFKQFIYGANLCISSK